MENDKPKRQADCLAPATWMADHVTLQSIDALKPYAQNNRTHTAKSLEKLRASIAQFGFVVPILVDGSGVIIAGHGRWEAAKDLGLSEVPTVIADHLTEAQVRALRVADNRLAELSEWNEDALRLEFEDLSELQILGDLDFDLTITGFETPEIDLILAVDGSDPQEEEKVEVPAPDALPISKAGDLWKLGSHRLLCGNAHDEEALHRLLDGAPARMVFTDPPFNVPVKGHVRSSGDTRHREFAMASGEMSNAEFRGFLTKSLEIMRDHMVAGGIAMVCMDWRHIEELIAAAKAISFDTINLCVWNKTNGGCCQKNRLEAGSYDA